MHLKQAIYRDGPNATQTEAGTIYTCRQGNTGENNLADGEIQVNITERGEGSQDLVQEEEEVQK